MKISDWLASLIRTVVPSGIGVAITWLCTELNIIVDEDTQGQIIGGFTGLAISIYYGAIRWAEERWAWVGWLLGLAKTPEYK